MQICLSLCSVLPALSYRKLISRLKTIFVQHSVYATFLEIKCQTIVLLLLARPVPDNKIPAKNTLKQNTRTHTYTERRALANLDFAGRTLQLPKSELSEQVLIKTLAGRAESVDILISNKFSSSSSIGLKLTAYKNNGKKKDLPNRLSSISSPPPAYYKCHLAENWKSFNSLEENVSKVDFLLHFLLDYQFVKKKLLHTLRQLEEILQLPRHKAACYDGSCHKTLI